MIPPFDENGNLPPGIYWAEWSEFQERFGTTVQRCRMIQGLQTAMEQLKAAGCRTIYINGSFVTSELNPNDFDACWDRDDVNIDYLRSNAPTLLNIYNREAQKAKYRGELFPSDQSIGDEGTMSLDFFQRDRLQNRKGIVAIDLLRWGAMIKNELEYSVTRTWVEKFGRALAALERNEEKKKKDPDGWQLHHDGVLSQLEDLQEQVAEYESFIAHDPNQPVVLKVENINKLSDLLIKARIAFKISQSELGHLCDRTEEQVKSYEDKNYRTASFIDFLAVGDALGIQIKDGYFFAELYDFYKDRLAAIRQSENLIPQIPTTP